MVLKLYTNKFIKIKIKLYIPNINFQETRPQVLFPLCRPFLGQDGWENKEVNFREWHMEGAMFEFINDITLAEFVLLPFSINYYFERHLHAYLNAISQRCVELGIKAYGFISGDFGIHLQEFENIIYLRASGFRSQLSAVNQGLPVFLSDHYSRIMETKEVTPREKNKMPKVGFCGHASLSLDKRVMEDLKVIRENALRIANNDWILEPIFPSAFHRARKLKSLERNKNIETNFIYRSQYRAGAHSEEEKKRTTLEYYHNIIDSDYVFCLRGGGNFSVRLYETLMCGRIPLFINTDCILPQADTINWKKHMIWIEWADRSKIAEILLDFHHDIHNDDLKTMQIANRDLWLNQLSVNGCLNSLI